MNDIQMLQQEIQQEFPDALVSMDASENPTGPWFLDIDRLNRPHIVVEWRLNQGFGISYKPYRVFGEGADEIRIHRYSALQRIRELLE